MQYFEAFEKRLEKYFASTDLTNQEDAPFPFELNQSILAGEYYSEDENIAAFYKRFNEKIETHCEFLSQYTQPEGYADLIPQEEPNEDKIELFYAKQDVARTLIDILNEYKSLNLLVENELLNFYRVDNVNTSRHNISEWIDSTLTKIIENSENNDFDFEYSRPQNDLFKINKILAQIDLNLTCAFTTIKYLYKILEAINSVKSDKKTNFLKQILIDKAHFLLYKIYYRKLLLASKENNEYDKNEYKDKLDSHKKNIFHYRHFVDKINEHYADHAKHALNEKEFGLKNLTKIERIEDFHYLNKEYRKSNNLDGIRRLQNHLKEIDNSTGNSIDNPFIHFNSISLRSIINLTNNSFIRSTLENDSSIGYKKTIQAIKDDGEGNLSHLIEVLELKEKFSSLVTSDYYPYKLLMIHLKALIKYLLEDPFRFLDKGEESINETSIIEKEIDKIKKIILRVENLIYDLINHLTFSFQYCKSKRMKPVYLSYYECIIPKDKAGFENAEMHLFVDSAYILPADYENVESAIKLFRESHESDLLSLTHVVNVEFNGKYFAKAFKKELEIKEFKSVQVLAMFITIATLILATIKAFEGRSTLSSLAIISSLAFTLLMFNYFIYLFVRGKFKLGALEIFLVLGIICVGWIYYYELNTVTKREVRDDFKSRIKDNFQKDSINQAKIDSLINVLQHPFIPEQKSLK